MNRKQRAQRRKELRAQWLELNGGVPGWWGLPWCSPCTRGEPHEVSDGCAYVALVTDRKRALAAEAEKLMEVAQ